MRVSYVKKICPCYGDKKEFMKKPRCYQCGYRKRCLLLCNGKQVYDVIN